MNKEIRIANYEPKSKIRGIKTGRYFEVTDYMYGCIDPNPNKKLSSISITGNSISIDIWTGCSFQCAYCHVQGVKEDLDFKTGKMRLKPQRRTCYDIDSILEELIKHPLFEKNIGIISIGTSSTEPFAKGEVLESTLHIMEWFVNKGLTNTFWIVTKAGIPSEAIDRIKEISKKNSIIISLCWANNIKDIEPVKNDRFLNADKFRGNDNVHLNWYLRPLVKEWSNNFENLEDIFRIISKKYKEDIESIVPGGLRWTEGIEYGMTEVRNLKLPANVSSFSRHNKTLTNEDFIKIKDLAKKYFGNIPVYKHSSCAISNALKVNSITLNNYLNHKDCLISECDENQRLICKIDSNIDLIEINKVFRNKGIDIELKKLNLDNSIKVIECIPDINNFAPAIKQQIVTIISYEILKNKSCLLCK